MKKYSKIIGYLGIASLMLVTGCTVEPAMGPTVMAYPGPAKNDASFNRDDSYCRSVASNQTGGISSSQASNQSLAESGGLGLVVGAASGALIGAVTGSAATGAAIGAGAGLLGGGALGLSSSQNSGRDVQNAYNQAYEQCMIGQNESIQGYQSYQRPPVYQGYRGYQGYNN